MSRVKDYDEWLSLQKSDDEFETYLQEEQTRLYGENLADIVKPLIIKTDAQLNYLKAVSERLKAYREALTKELDNMPEIDPIEEE